MARLGLCLLALCVAGAFAEPLRRVLPHRNADPVLLKKQVELMYLFYHVHEPTFVPEHKTIVSEWHIEKNIDHFSNVTAVTILADLYDHEHNLPRGVPFNILNSIHRFEAVTAYNVLVSAKDYETFYKSAVVYRHYMNEGLFIYVLSTAILHRQDTQGVIIPPIYEIFPSYFHNGEIMTTAQRINSHGMRLVESYPTTYVWNNNVVIRSNWTVWPYHHEDVQINYLTHDHQLNTFYYNWHIAYPFWLGGESFPLVRDRRGEWLWFIHKQILTRYYMERLSNGLGEIPELGLDVVESGYQSGLLYHNGIPYPARSSHYHLDQPHLVDEINQIIDYERRIRDAIESGYILNDVGEHISILNADGIDILGRVIEANADSPNTRYYQDFVGLWKIVLGNSIWRQHAVYVNGATPLVVPSVLENYQTALRDPAFYMIWKRVLNLFNLLQHQMPPYQPEQLALPSVVINNVEVDKLVTYFENNYVNVTNHLHLNEIETMGAYDDVSVLVERMQLNHKVFQVRVKVTSESAKTVVVRFFLAPKYDSEGYEMPLHMNTENFYQLDLFTYELPAGESVIRRDSSQNLYTSDDWQVAHDVFEHAEQALHGKGQVVLDQSHRWTGFPDRLMLPKGRVGGMPFQLLVYISEYRAPKVPYGTGFDPALSLGLGTGATRIIDDPLGYPLNRPLWQWQIQNLRNLWIQEVNIYHKPTPDITLPNPSV